MTKFRVELCRYIRETASVVVEGDDEEVVLSLKEVYAEAPDDQIEWSVDYEFSPDEGSHFLVDEVPDEEADFVVDKQGVVRRAEKEEVVP